MTNQPENIVIVGTGAAGQAAHEELRKKGFDGKITIVGHENHRPYMRPPLSKGVLVGKASPSDFMLEITEHEKTEWRLGVEVTGLDVAARVLKTDEGDIKYDRLLIATGGVPIIPAPWKEAGGLTLRSWDDALTIAKRAETAKSAIVIGGGFIGTEVASSLRQRDIDVTLVAADPQLLPAALEAGGVIVEQLHKTAGVDVRLNAMVETVTATENGGVEVALSDKTKLNADLLVVGIGVRPATDFLKNSSIKLDEQGAVIADESLLVPDTDGIIAVAGDIANAPHPLARGENIRVEHWFWAAGQGAHAAKSLLGDAKAHTELPVFASLQYDTKIFVHGLPQLGTATIVRQSDSGTDPVLAAQFSLEDGTIVGAVTVNADEEQGKFKADLSESIKLQKV